jgi:hypothetical protein
LFASLDIARIKGNKKKEKAKEKAKEKTKK